MSKAKNKVVSQHDARCEGGAADEKTESKQPTFGDRLRAARKAKNLTQKQFADALGCQDGAIEFYESGAVQPTAETFKKTRRRCPISTRDDQGRQRPPTPQEKRDLRQASIEMITIAMSRRGQEAVIKWIQVLLKQSPDSALAVMKNLLEERSTALLSAMAKELVYEVECGNAPILDPGA